MIEFLVLIAATNTPLELRTLLPCDGVKVIEAALEDRPLPFASLRQQSQVLATVRNAQGQRVQQLVPVTNVKPVNGFSNCRFVYTNQIDLACYVGTTYARSEADNISAALIQTASGLRQCLGNTKLAQANEEEGSSPVITFGAGPSEPFWQVSMVPLPADPDRVQPEVLILPSVSRANPATAVSRPRPKAKRTTKRR